MERAVREMGDPVETGVSLDHIHRPQMSWGIVIGIGLISLLSIGLFYVTDILSLSASYYYPCEKQAIFSFAGFLLMLLGIVILGFGSAVQAYPNFGRGAYEAFTFAFVDKNGWSVKWVRIILDVLMVVAGGLLGAKIGLCIVATIPICGPVIQVSLKWLNKTFPKSNNA